MRVLQGAPFTSRIGCGEFVKAARSARPLTPKTRQWYESAWKGFTAAAEGCARTRGHRPVDSQVRPSRFVVHLRERGVKPVTCNTWLPAMNAFSHWLHEQGELPERVKLPPHRLEKRIIRTRTRNPQHVQIPDP